MRHQEDPTDSTPTTPDTDPLLARLARNIRHFRGQRGMTRRNLADQSGVSLPHLARLESSQGNVSVLVLDKVARALNRPIGQLFDDEEPLTGDLAVIVEFLKRQPAAQLARIRTQLFEQYEPKQQDKADRIALIGLRGAGKSSVGRLLADRLGRPFVELNREVEKEAGISLQEILNLYGQSGYRNLERRCLERLITTYPDMILATGGGIVVEPLTYEMLLSACLTVWLHADPEVHFKRVMAQHDIRIAQPALYREAMDNIHRTLEARDALYRMADQGVDTTTLSVEEVVSEILARVAAGTTP